MEEFVLSSIEGESLSEQLATPFDGVGKRPPPHHWSQAQRRTLCILRLWFESTGNTKEATFRAIRHLLILRFEHTPGSLTLQNISIAAVSAQCHELMRIRNSLWKSIARKSRQDLESEITLLQNIITQHGLDLIPRATQYVPSPKTVNAPMSIRRRQRQESSQDSDYEKYREPRQRSNKVLRKQPLCAPATKKLISAALSISPPPTSPSVRRQLFKSVLTRSTSNSSSPAPPSKAQNLLALNEPKDCEITGKKVIRTGTRICFRFWYILNDRSLGISSHGMNRDNDSQGSFSKETGFLAGSVSKQGLITPPIPPPQMSSERFRSAAKAHLTMKKNPEGSPFISIVRKSYSPLLANFLMSQIQWQSLLPAVHRALRSQTNAFIAVIDARRLSLCQPHTYPDILPAGVVVKDLKKRNDVPTDWYYRGNSL